MKHTTEHCQPPDAGKPQSALAKALHQAAQPVPGVMLVASVFDLTKTRYLIFLHCFCKRSQKASEAIVLPQTASINLHAILHATKVAQQNTSYTYWRAQLKTFQSCPLTRKLSSLEAFRQRPGTQTMIAEVTTTSWLLRSESVVANRWSKPAHDRPRRKAVPERPCCGHIHTAPALCRHIC